MVLDCLALAKEFSGKLIIATRLASLFQPTFQQVTLRAGQQITRARKIAYPSDLRYLSPCSMSK